MKVATGLAMQPKAAIVMAVMLERPQIVHVDAHPQPKLLCGFRGRHAALLPVVLVVALLQPKQNWLGTQHPRSARGIQNQAVALHGWRHCAHLIGCMWVPLRSQVPAAVV